MISISVPQVALMPRLLKTTISSSVIMWVEWSSADSSLLRFSRTFFTIGFVVEQMERARRTSPSFR